MKSRPSSTLVLIFGICLMAGCGHQDNQPTNPATSAAAQQAIQQSIQAQQQRDTYNCPGLKSGELAEKVGTPPDDLFGIRLGMPAPLVERILGCHEGYTVTHDGSGGRFDVPLLNQPPQPLGNLAASTSNNQDQTAVLLVGMPGSELAEKLSRLVTFPSSESQPSADTEKQALIQKYGTPTSDEKNPGSEILHWVYDNSGNQMNLQNPDYAQCASIGGYNSRFSIYRGCGLTIFAQINSLTNGATDNVSIGIMNHTSAQMALDAEKAETEKRNKPTGAGTKF